MWPHLAAAVQATEMCQRSAPPGQILEEFASVATAADKLTAAIQIPILDRQTWLTAAEAPRTSKSKLERLVICISANY